MTELYNQDNNPKYKFTIEEINSLCKLLENQWVNPNKSYAAVVDKLFQIKRAHELRLAQGNNKSA